MKILLLLLSLVTTVPVVRAQYDFTCNLYCYNGGQCMHGKGKFGNYAGIQDEEEMPWERTTNEISMYCSCPVGYTGLQCEIKLVVCGEDGIDTTHTCFNGSECKKERSGNGKLYFRCECDPENSIMTANYAGKYCEHIATTFCGVRDGDVGSSPNFCSNGGKCLEKENEEQTFIGCECPEGWTGKHCQYAVETAETEDLFQVVTKKKNVAKIVGFLILSVFGATLILMYLDNRKKKKEKEKRRDGASSYRSRFQKNRSTGEMA